MSLADEKLNIFKKGDMLPSQKNFEFFSRSPLTLQTWRWNNTRSAPYDQAAENPSVELYLCIYEHCDC